jgi:hypothetical protein
MSEIEPVDSVEESSSSSSSYDNSVSLSNDTAEPQSSSPAVAADEESQGVRSNIDDYDSDDGFTPTSEGTKADSARSSKDDSETVSGPFKDTWSSFARGTKDAEKSGDPSTAGAADSAEASPAKDESSGTSGEVKEGEETGNSEDTAETGESKDNTEAKDSKDTKGTRDTGESSASTSKDVKDAKETKDTKEAKDAKDRKDAEKAKDDGYQDQLIGLLKQERDLLTKMIKDLGGDPGLDSIKASGSVNNSKLGDTFNSFKQGAEGNCSSVASIKAAMEKFGDNVFNKMDGSAKDGYDITMKDGYNLKLSPQELETAQRMNQMEGSGSAKDFADVAYAAMAKRALNEGHEGAGTYARACHSLNNGEDPYHAAHFLGMDNNMRTISLDELGSARGAVAWSATHAVNVDNGYTDHYGNRMYYNMTDTNNKWLDGAFVFE